MRQLPRHLSGPYRAQDPWLDVASRMGPGTKFKAVVTRVESFGAFVELAPGVEGLVHISELAGGKQAFYASSFERI